MRRCLHTGVHLLVDALLDLSIEITQGHRVHPATTSASDRYCPALVFLGANHEDVRQAIEWAASGRVDAKGINTHVLPIEEAQRGMELARSKDEGATKVALSFDGFTDP